MHLAVIESSVLRCSAQSDLRPFKIIFYDTVDVFYNIALMSYPFAQNVCKRVKRSSIQYLIRVIWRSHHCLGQVYMSENTLGLAEHNLRAWLFVYGIQMLSHLPQEALL